MKYRDVFWVDIRAQGGHVQHGRRPAIIWQDTDVFTLPTVLVIPLTSNQKTLRFDGTVLIQPSAQNGLAVPSVALVFQLAATDTQFLGKQLGHLDDPDLQAVADMARKLQRL